MTVVLQVELQCSMTFSFSFYVKEPAGDPVVNKYVASGLPREAVALAVLNYGDNPLKVHHNANSFYWIKLFVIQTIKAREFIIFFQVREFVKGYNLLREMGFSSKSVAEALAMYDNDTDKALAHFLNSS